MVDSGAQGNFISPTVVVQHLLPTEVKEDGYCLVLADGGLAANGLIDVQTKPVHMGIGGHSEYIQFDVTKIGKHDIILGLPWMELHDPSIDWKTRQLKFDNCPDCFKDEITAVGPREVGATSKEGLGHQEKGPLMKDIPSAYHRFEALFKEELGIEALPEHQDYDHRIELAEGTQPIFQPLREYSATDLMTIKQYIDENLTKGFIRESRSPWGSNVLFAEKKDGGRRMCIDYRRLNEATKKDRYALPLAKELRDRLSGAKIFTQLDLRGAYNLVRMAKGEEEKTAFRTRFGHYEYTVMPFGLTNAPATFQRLINNILRQYLDVTCICYLDDILVYSKTEEQHVKDVTAILEKLEAAKMLLKPEKCHFHKKEVTFLGYVVTTTGLAMDPKKIKAILEWTGPTNVKELQSFLGFANFYRRFIKGYSKIAGLLTELTHKDKEFVWTEKAQAAFQALKDAFVEEPVLTSFTPDGEIRIETDSSDYAIGAVLSQKGENGR
jgi:hypothetical protein